jgi:hypothetical protein
MAEMPKEEQQNVLLVNVTELKLHTLINFTFYVMYQQFCTMKIWDKNV